MLWQRETQNLSYQATLRDNKIVYLFLQFWDILIASCMLDLYFSLMRMGYREEVFNSISSSLNVLKTEYIENVNLMTEEQSLRGAPTRSWMPYRKLMGN